VTAPEGTWVLLSRALARVPECRREAEEREIMQQIADRRLSIRFLNADDADALKFAPLAAGEKIGARTPRANYRYDRLPDLFFRLGVVNWLFSAVTFNGRTIHQIEIFVPDEVAAADVGAPAVEPYLTGCQGKPTSKYLLLAEAELKLSNGWPGTKLEAFASELLQWLGKEHPRAPRMGQSAARNALRDLFNRYKRNA